MAKKFLLILLILLSFPVVLAHGPNTHVLLTLNELSDSRLQTSPFYNVMKNNQVYVVAGSLMIDYSVPCYVTDYVYGNSCYGATHNPAFQQCLMSTATSDQQMAVSLGVEMSLIQDSVMHNEGVENAIKSSGLINLISHAPYEAAEDALVIKENPTIFPYLQTSLQPILNDPQMIAWIDSCMNKQQGLSGNFNTKEALLNLNSLYANPNSFYAKLFLLPSLYEKVANGDLFYGIVALAFTAVFFLITWKLRLDNNILEYAIRVFSGFVMVIIGLIAFLLLVGGLASFANPTEIHNLIQKSNNQVLFYFQAENWSSRIGVDSTGFALLKLADHSAYLTSSIIGILIVALVAIVIYIKVRD